VVAVGTELLLGQVVDTNSAWVGDRLALSGIDCLRHTVVGDNEERIAAAVREALERADAVLVCGGLGPTPDDVTREAVANALGVTLERDPSMVERIREIFAARHRQMADNNLRQADRPSTATFIPQEGGTAPGLVCPVGDGGERVVYAVPGVPSELREMVERAVVPDLVRRAGRPGVILSRMLRTWGLSESALADRIASRVEMQTNPTIAFLASGIEGIKVRVTAKGNDEVDARRLLDAEEAELRSLIGDVVFGVDDQSMERVVADLLVERELTLGVAESLTGGLVGSRLAETEGASRWFRGSVVAYDSKVKYALLDVPEGPVVCEEAAVAMARGVCGALLADVGLGVTGVAGPATQEDQPVGTVFMAVADSDGVETREVHFPGDRQHVRQYACITLLDLARRRLLARD
jgi:nicotinamide-nucleotide amidase